MPSGVEEYPGRIEACDARSADPAFGASAASTSRPSRARRSLREPPLHGFGFASGLTAMGLPRAEIPLALLMFNAGVEAGQRMAMLLGGAR